MCNDIIENSCKDFVCIVRVKGIKEFKIYNVYILCNLMILFIMFLGFDFVIIISGFIIIEMIFMYLGIGKLFVDFVVICDYLVMMLFIMLFLILILVGNLVVDLLYGVVDLCICLD